LKPTRKKTTLTTIEAARILGVAVSSVSKWIDEGKLTAGRTPGGHRRIEREDLVWFLQRQKLRIPPELQNSPPRVLVVDDEPPFAQWLEEEIRDRYPDFEVILAHDGYSAGEIVGLVKPEVIVLDLHIPGMDGFEVCARIKSNPRTRNASVIAITADPSAQARSRILELGACACLEKPFDASLLLGEIAKALTLPSGPAR
jgi:excisionase family DNA binding protein